METLSWYGELVDWLGTEKLHSTSIRIFVYL